MNIWAQVLWLWMGLGLIAYAITGGADLGAGLWSAFASGPRKQEQRAAVAHAIGPIWEANHVWLIFVIVVMFSAFSNAFAAICIALHIPIALALLGTVFRGAAYVFQAYGIQSETSRQNWLRVFAWSSAATPLVWGMVVGGLSTEEIQWVDGRITSGFFAGWTTWFAILVGLFACALFALLSAVYLAAEASGPVSDDFRRRAMAMELVAGVFAVLVFVRAGVDAPALYTRLAHSAFTWPIQIATAIFAAVTFWALWSRRLALSRITAAGQVALVVVGWGASMDQHFILPDMTLERATPNVHILPYLAVALSMGAIVLGPALFYLYRVFKWRA